MLQKKSLTQNNSIQNIMKTKKIIFIIFLTMIFRQGVNGQEFLFPLYFEDAIGNKDTLILGYDINATYSIDTLFGESNIISQPWDNTFEARASNTQYLYDTTKIQSKTFIVPPSGQFIIEVKMKNFPVLIEWDNAIFQNNNSIIGTYLLQYTDGYNFFHNQNYLLLLSHFNGHGLYYTATNDTISYFIFRFCDTSCLWLGINDLSNNLFETFPNPSEDIIYLKSNGLETLKIIEVYESNGNFIKRESTNIEYIDISKLPKGIYFLKVISNLNSTETIKFIKN